MKAVARVPDVTYRPRLVEKPATSGIRALQSWAEIILPVFGIAVGLVYAWTRFPLVGTPYGGDTLLLIVGSVVAIVIGSFATGRRGEFWKSDSLPAWSTSFSKYRNLVLMALTAALFVSDFVYYIGQGSIGSGDISELRDLRNEVLEGRADLRRIIWILAPAGPLAAFWINRYAFSVSWHVGFCLVMMLHSYFQFRFTASRAELLAIVPVYFSAFIIFNLGRYLPSYKRAFAVCGAAVALVVTANIGANIVAERGGFESRSALTLTENGDVILDYLGLRNPPLELSVSVGLLDEYIAAPIFYFDFYLENNEFPPAYGSHCFDFVAGKIGFEDGPTIKRMVDELYLVLGRQHNVWGTALREVCIDTGVFGLIPAMFAFGAFVGLVKRFGDRMESALFMYVLCVAWLVVMPMTSTTKSMAFELAIYVGAVAMLVEWINVFGKTRR